MCHLKPNIALQCLALFVVSVCLYILSKRDIDDLIMGKDRRKGWFPHPALDRALRSKKREAQNSFMCSNIALETLLSAEYFL